jgi:hypothetical protein
MHSHRVVKRCSSAAALYRPSALEDDDGHSKFLQDHDKTRPPYAKLKHQTNMQVKDNGNLKILELYYSNFGNKEIYCSFKACCTIYCIFHKMPLIL